MLHLDVACLPVGKPGDCFTQQTALLATELVAVWFEEGDRSDFLEFIVILEKDCDWG